MSQNYLHVMAGTRWDNTSVIAGDRAALVCLRDAIEQALDTGSGGTCLLSSDGEPHKIAVVFESDMCPVYTSYAQEAAPARSRRETVPIEQLRNYADALAKASTALHPKHPALPAFAVSVN